MPRHKMDLGEHGKIALTGYVYDQDNKRVPIPPGARKADTWQAFTRVRDLDGIVRISSATNDRHQYYSYVEV